MLCWLSPTVSASRVAAELAVDYVVVAAVVPMPMLASTALGVQHSFLNLCANNNLEKNVLLYHSSYIYYGFYLYPALIFRDYCYFQRLYSLHNFD